MAHGRAGPGDQTFTGREPAVCSGQGHDPAAQHREMPPQGWRSPTGEGVRERRGRQGALPSEQQRLIWREAGKLDGLLAQNQSLGF